jgi:uncharacterized HAD superfamily protein
MLPIYVDIDDVLADTSSALISLADKEFHKKVAYEDVTSFDLKVSFDLTRDEYEYFLERAHQPAEILNMAPIQASIEALNRWRAAGYEIAIVTGRPTTTYATTLEWLAIHDVPYDRFLMVDKYARQGMDETISLSIKALSELEFCFAIEDSYDMAVHLAENMDTLVFLYDRPWNRSASQNGNIRRFRSWEEIDRHFKISCPDPHRGT